MNTEMSAKKYLSVKFLTSLHEVNIVILVDLLEIWMLKAVIRGTCDILATLMNSEIATGGEL